MKTLKIIVSVRFRTDGLHAPKSSQKTKLNAIAFGGLQALKNSKKVSAVVTTNTSDT